MTYATDWISGFSSFEGETICWGSYFHPPEEEEEGQEKPFSFARIASNHIYMKAESEDEHSLVFPQNKMNLQRLYRKCLSLSCLSGSFCFPNLDLVFKRGKKTNLHCFLFKRTQDDSIKTAFHCYKENVLQFRTKKPYLFDKAHRHFPLIRTLSNEIFRVLVLSFYCSK